MTVKNPPENYPHVSPYLLVENAAEAIVFYEKVLGAKARFILPNGNKIGHAELQVGDSVIMLADACPEMGMQAPDKEGRGRSTLVYVPDVDKAMEIAAQNGGTVMMPAKDQFYGDRFGMVRDPFGHMWSLATHIRDVSEQEMKEAADRMSSGKTPG